MSKPVSYSLVNQLDGVKIPRCCLEHLERRGHGLIIAGTHNGKPAFRFIPNPCLHEHGVHARCRTCHRVWQHVCGDKKCEWICRTPEFELTPAGKAARV